MFLYGNTMFLFVNDMFLFGNYMFLFEDNMFLFGNDMFPAGGYEGRGERWPHNGFGQRSDPNGHSRGPRSCICVEIEKNMFLDFARRLW